MLLVIYLQYPNMRTITAHSITNYPVMSLSCDRMHMAGFNTILYLSCIPLLPSKIETSIQKSKLNIIHSYHILQTLSVKMYIFHTPNKHMLVDKVYPRQTRSYNYT